MGAEKESRPINCGPWFRLPDPLVVLFQIIFVCGKIILDFGDLKKRLVTVPVMKM